MADNLSDIVQITITKETTAIDTASFNIPMILTEDATFSERVRQYSSITALAEDFDSQSDVYAMASRLFGDQGSRPAYVLVGSKKEDDATWADAIANIEQENSVWYGVVATTHEPEDVLSIASAIQARRKIFGTSTQDPSALTTGDTDIGSLLSEFNYDRTYWVYSPFADEDFPEAAWMGSQMPMTPGSNTWAFKQATAVRSANLTDTQKTNIRNKNGNTVTRRAGVVIFEDGRMADGTWIDEVVGIDWWVARVQEAIFFRLINSRKVPMTRAGASIIETEIRSVNALGVANGLIADDTPATVTAPDPLRIPANMRAQRTLGDFRVRFRLSGAVHRVLVDAVVGI